MMASMTMLHHRHNDITSGVLHIVGAGLAIAALVLMIVFAAKSGGALKVTTVSIFGAGMIFLYIASAAYHLMPHHRPRAKQFLRRLDHAMIFVLIAATYTPICLVGLGGGWGWSIFGIVWGIAVVGFSIKMLDRHPPMWASVVMYIAMGWLILIAFSPLIHNLSGAALMWLAIGGVIYTSGAALFALDHALPRIKIFGMHEWFHLFVIGGSFAHFWMVLLYL
ncbi:MAG: hemolysin [Candidatus Kerfeldbacteria bacterium CG15_BIG_FIL_POST_REV_8_21_14_020_45_12]|uniref:Hemolysin n=1 Tax=Candidatus Kerfeldbacteria bacterium CG15_BIG_FIL_POST_REV_8_21_14_020_45_12 TaxID=2014247 RepID=A0A2M7H567_9BACT|nr:MAG: hemolysin [Candidatus Kerfeldbacteria bacterium CG15_BIG_FIL_POST_REV_8_21_14_020_45_12]PJA92812.1 MAG: hemolysin [Candidatus Kerfeldbacteria bacterium CG_4_9_14_3_um_filter_45_8]